MKKAFIFSICFLPAFTFAAQTPQTFADLIGIFIDLILMLWPLAIGVAILVFFWGMARFILHAGEEKGRDEGKQIMKWGLIGLFVAVSFFGILTFFYGEFEFGQFGLPRLPTGSVGLHNVG